MLKALIWIVILIVLLAGGAYGFYFLVPPDPAEQLQPVQLKTIRRSAHGAGVIEGNSVVTHLKFPFPGIVDEIDAKENSTVHQGDIVAKLNATEIDDKIALENVALKEAKAKRDAVAARKNADQAEKKEAELKRAHAETLEAEKSLRELKMPAAPVDRQEQQENAKLALDHAQRAAALAEAEQRQLLSHPTPHELEAADARLSLAKIRNEEVKRTGQGAEAAAAELRYALADYDKIKHGASAEEKEVAAARCAQAKTEVERAEAEKRRIDKPLPPPPIPTADIELATKTLTERQAWEDKKRAELDQLRKDADSADSRLADAAVERCELTLKSLNTMKKGYELHAPFDAIVVKRLVEPDSLLAPNEDVLWILAFSRKLVRAEFDVEKLPALNKPGLIATIKSRAFGKEELAARVIEIGKVGTRKLIQDDPSQPKGGEVVEVLMEIDPPADAEKKPLYDLLRPGLRVESDIVLESRANVLSVPRSYISSEKGENGADVMYVMKVDANARKSKSESARKQEVVCGIRDEYYVEILDGLTKDDLVIKPRSQGK